MTVASWPDHLLTLEEWDALPEDTSRHVELVEGVLVVSPRAAPHHNTAMGNLMVAINRQLPSTLVATQDSEVVVNPGFPATVRAPDVLVTSASRYRQNPPRFDAGDVLLAIEIISPGSVTTDRVTKLVQYAQAGIPHYWIVDLKEPATLVAHTLVDGCYEVAAKATSKVTLAEPATVTVDVSRLTEPRY
ncbi:MAG: Uma2 family endonuclease [Actinophytocola sp.]|uniref:Uma2 family endonuclease n=1 Tax=Actinophytocola sp. TaxID=1872138 RepID=UPI0013245FEC|nr:Uma2 family endonuclease [Actinophytocola sp.]MPZ81536.1 Uma2 family endonuclease [Actinophytocola sp.]